MRIHSTPLLATRLTLVAATLLVTAATGRAQSETAAAAAPRSSNVVLPVYDALGTYARKVSTSSAQAQSYFDQGLRLTFGFGHPTAKQSFREAIRQDSTCAMCWWGLAWALGPYINAGMDSTSGVEAYAAVQAAQRHAARGTGPEKALISAMATRYVAVPTRANRKPLDSAYANAMRNAMNQLPNDLDVASLFGEALMVLRPWDQWTRSGQPQPGTEEVLKTLESVLARNPRHPGACHHYIHATEASTAPQRAAACADLLGAVIPGASHIPHMPSHTYMRMGRYADAVRANQDAVIADIRASYGGVPGIYPPHNLEMLLTSATMDGQSGVALQASRDVDRRYPNSGHHEQVILARFGRWDEILSATPPVGGLSHASTSAFARGLAYLATGNRNRAQEELRNLDVLLAGSPTANVAGHPAKAMIGIPRAILSAELDAANNRFDAAIATLRAAAILEDSLNYDEPEPWPIPVRHVLGAVQLEAGQVAEAERTYREDLADHPQNGWALFGLERALRIQGKHADADATAAEFKKAWARADVWLTGSRFAPRPPAR